MVARWRLPPIHRGVYLVGPIHGPLAPLMAAALALGDGAAVSHRSGGGLWELGLALPDSVTVTLVGRQTRCRDGIHVHHARRLAPPI